MEGAVDCISLWMSREAIDRFIEEHEIRTFGSLRTEGVAFGDHVAEGLGEALVLPFDSPDTASQLFIDCIALGHYVARKLKLLHTSASRQKQTQFSSPSSNGGDVTSKFSRHRRHSFLPLRKFDQ